MFKASIALVILAFVTLTYGWIQGIDVLLFGSIALSALAGIALLRSTIAERRKHQSAVAASKQRSKTAPAKTEIDDASLRGDRDRRSLAELSRERERARAGAEKEDFFGGRRPPIRVFGDGPAKPIPVDDFGPEVEGTDILERTLAWAEAPPRKREPAGSEDFRSRLASVLGEGMSVSPEPLGPIDDEDDEIETDWIRIEDVPRIARATQQGGGYARPDVPPVQPPKRRPPAAGAPPAKPASPRRPPAASAGGESATPARRRTSTPGPKPAAPRAAPGRAPSATTRPAGTRPATPRTPKPAAGSDPTQPSRPPRTPPKPKP